MNPFSMFFEKDPEGKNHWSMTRVVAFLFALTYCYGLLVYAKNKSAINWPFCVLGVVVLLAVPLQALFKMIQAWLATREGQTVLSSIAEHFVGNMSPQKIATATHTETTVTHEG